ncbi:MAG: GGDEF domain-containing protein [Candidatus Accumulibacter sp. 66-26]|nr:GGDEF domain-containing protein [Accumulibacter sp.]OJW48002.1 MAG: GGDEF domain-containing protein [Candidatus Accumulibacter sp. 66-26]
MPSFTNPSEIARETLRMLASRRIPPSPDNYRALYNEIAGSEEKAADTFPETELKTLLASLPKETPAQQGLARQLEQALRGKNWDDYRKTLVDFVKEHSAENELGWSELIGDFLRQWEAKQSGLTAARKRESLEHVLSGGANNDAVLFGRLQSLVRSWSLNGAAPDELALVEGEVEPAAAVASSTAAAPADAPPVRGGTLSDLRDLFAYTLEGAVAAQLPDEPELAAEARALAAAVRGASTPKAMEALQAGIKRLAFRLELLSEDRAELRTGLLHLLQLLIDNAGELVLDDHWLHGQIEAVREIVARPLNTRAIDDAERRIREVIVKQSQLKSSLSDAQEALKSMLAGFVDHLAEFADATSDYHDKIEVCAEKISKTQNISQLEDVLTEVMHETRIVQLNAQRSRDELRAAKQRAIEAEQRISELQSELDKASDLVRHDQLTGTLNRRGLEEIFAKEAGRAQRRHSPLCVALLDIDNFKKLNDTLGHAAGDAALIHLAAVIRETMRPQDTIARLGGEEFLILLPDTDIEDASRAVVRLQRELTKKFFLHNNDKLLITFSAGVTSMAPGDSQASLIERADKAMYHAKQTGKNKVSISPVDAPDQIY